MKYNFYGWQDTKVSPINKKYLKVENPRVLYDMLSNIWCEYSCAPRLRKDWSESNKTLGQCSITAFLVQDIFGGEVYGIPLASGGVHCFNIVNGHKFDLASEQFGDEVLDYVNDTIVITGEVNITELVNKFMAESIAIVDIKTKQASIEDYYLSIIGGVRNA